MNATALRIIAAAAVLIFAGCLVISVALALSKTI